MKQKRPDLCSWADRVSRSLIVLLSLVHDSGCLLPDVTVRGQDSDAMIGMPHAGSSTATLTVLPSPSYSGFDGTHTYQIPLKVNNKAGAKWSVDNPNLVDIQETADGVMLTTKGAGEVLVTATIGNDVGASKLSIAQFTPDLWSIGDKRYNSGVTVFPGDGGVPTGNPGPSFMLDKDGSCSSCHGATAPTLRVEDTPYQTGGYSDAEMITIFTRGMKPAGAVQRSYIPSYFWGMFHEWNVTDAQKQGLVGYMRALTPKSQGEFDYPIRPGADGGLAH
ncbi:MAG: hypothetical protein JWN04_3475 [Myxococcaceae bacterium]|nr:hypothetical protein [Myxococcaceae bacterium]